MYFNIIKGISSEQSPRSEVARLKGKCIHRFVRNAKFSFIAARHFALPPAMYEDACFETASPTAHCQASEILLI